MAGADQCKAIAISTGQQCTRKGKLDGYCTEKHREQANGIIPTKAKPRRKQRDTTPSADSDAEYNDEDEDKDENYEEEDESAPVAAKKATKTSKTVKIADIEKSTKVDDVTTPAPTKKKAAPRAKAAPKTTVKTTGRKKKTNESSDEFDSVSEDDDYKPSDNGDYTDSESDDDDDSEDDLEGLSSKLASVKIKSSDPTLPPQTPNDASGTPLKTKLQRTKSKIFSTNAVLAPPKNKTKSSSASGRPTGGFWVPAPPPVKIPESTIKALAVVKDKLKFEDSSSSEVVSAGAHAAPEQKPSGLFKYHARVHQYLFTSDEDLDPDSKRVAMRKFVNDLGSFFHRLKKGSDSDPGSADKKPLPEIPSDKQDTSTAVIKPPKQQHTDSQDSVDSITQDIQDLEIKSEEEEEIPNQCHGFNTSGYRCKRRVKLDRPMEKGEVLMCHDHEINEDDEVVIHIEGQGGVLLQWLELSVWVNPGLPDYVQNKLRKAMERPVSETDKPGYIYSYQLKEIRMTSTHTLFKVGRTDNVYRRMNEWSDKCGSPPILIEVFPEQGALAPKDENDLADSISKSVSDTDVTGLRCRYSHRVERLIHIELKPYHDKDHVCSCKTNHREWFKVPHKPGLNDKEQFQQAWEQIRRVCVHWMAYMERVYGPG